VNCETWFLSFFDYLHGLSISYTILALVLSFRCIICYGFDMSMLLSLVFCLCFDIWEFHHHHHPGVLTKLCSFESNIFISFSFVEVNFCDLICNFEFNLIGM